VGSENTLADRVKESADRTVSRREEKAAYIKARQERMDPTRSPQEVEAEFEGEPEPETQSEPEPEPQKTPEPEPEPKPAAKASTRKKSA
jgi:hypothetical protein